MQLICLRPKHALTNYCYKIFTGLYGRLIGTRSRGAEWGEGVTYWIVCPIEADVFLHR